MMVMGPWPSAGETVSASKRPGQHSCPAPPMHSDTVQSRHSAQRMTLCSTNSCAISVPAAKKYFPNANSSTVLFAARTLFFSESYVASSPACQLRDSVGLLARVVDSNRPSSERLLSSSAFVQQGLPSSTTQREKGYPPGHRRSRLRGICIEIGDAISVLGPIFRPHVNHPSLDHDTAAYCVDVCTYLIRISRRSSSSTQDSGSEKA
ncbi:hypothetical protein EV126DRAFT_124376 [Verticillium dahliae]|nr:hypothetical protein EV126DRAFT_124376 [Verticillium dahliae]